MRVIKAKLFLLAVVLLSVLVAPVSAQQRIKITEGQVAPTPIAIAEIHQS